MKITENENVLLQLVLIHISLKMKIQIHNPFCLSASVPSASKIINRSAYFKGKSKMNHFYHLGVHTYSSHFKNSQIQNTVVAKNAHKNVILKLVSFVPLPLVSPNTILEDEIVDTSQFFSYVVLTPFPFSGSSKISWY